MTLIEDRKLTRREILEARFTELATGKPWYEGVSEDDAIFPHQWTAMCFGTVARRFFLGDEPGMGKTRSSIGWLDLVGSKKVILIAEANVCSQFAGEIMDLAPHRTVVVLSGLTKKTRQERIAKAMRLSEAVLVINYEMFRLDKDSLNQILAWQADSVIVDEAHNMKSVRTANFKIVQRILLTDNTCERCGGLITGLSKPCKRCLHQRPHETIAEQKRSLEHYLAPKSVKNVCLMTGTPMLNTPTDLYSIFHLIDPVRFPTLQGFTKTYLKPSYIEGSRRMVFKRDGMERLHPHIKNFYIARTLSEVGIELPKQHVRVVRVDLDPERYPLQKRVIDQVSKHAQITLTSGEKMTLMHVIQIILRKRQANVWPGGINLKDAVTGEVIFTVGKEVQESVKLDVALELMLQYRDQGKRVVLFSQFKTALEELEKRAVKAGIRAARFDGDTPSRTRDAIKKDFGPGMMYEPLDKVRWDAVLAHYRTGGAGLNLQSCEATIILDEEWNPGKERQAFARNHRVGQTRETEVAILRIPATVDTWMAALINRKRKLVEDFNAVVSRDELISKITTAIKEGTL